MWLKWLLIFSFRKEGVEEVVETGDKKIRGTGQTEKVVLFNLFDRPR